jgi:hypothetical protein
MTIGCLSSPLTQLAAPRLVPLVPARGLAIHASSLCKAPVASAHVWCRAHSVVKRLMHLAGGRALTPIASAHPCPACRPKQIVPCNKSFRHDFATCPYGHAAESSVRRHPSAYLPFLCGATQHSTDLKEVSAWIVWGEQGTATACGAPLA